MSRPHRPKPAGETAAPAGACGGPDEACEELRCGCGSLLAAPARLTVALALAAALAAPRPAAAAHPLVTDDAETLGVESRQLELTGEWGRDRAPGAVTTLQEDTQLTATFSWGLRHDLDLVVGLPLSWSRVSGGGLQASGTGGLGDVTVEAKWRLLEADGFGLAVKPGLTLPTGDVQMGTGTGRTCFGAALLATQALGPATLSVNAGYGHDEYALAEDRAAARADHWHASAALSGQVLAGLQVAANLGIETSTAAGSHTAQAFALCGLIYGVTETLDLDLGVKAGLTAPEPDLVLLAGLTTRF